MLHRKDINKFKELDCGMLKDLL